MNERLENRLYNYKFSQAMQYLDGESPEIKQLVKALDETFGDGSGGNMSVIICNALENIGVDFSS